MTSSDYQRLGLFRRDVGIFPSANPPDVPADWKLCCGDDSYRKYVGPDNSNRCYERQPNNKWTYTYGSRCDNHDHECYARFCAFNNV